MRILLCVLLPPLMIAACLLIVLATPLPEPLPQAWSDGRSTIAAVMTGVLGFAYVVGTGLFVLLEISRAGRAMDAVFHSVGLAFVSRQAFACRYAGTLQGREATAEVSPPFKFQPWRLRLSIYSAPGARIAIGSHRPLLDCRDAARLILGDDRLDACHIHADEVSARRLLDRQDVRIVLHQLLADLSAASSWEIYFGSGDISIRVRVYGLSESVLLRWLNGLSDLAAACENSSSNSTSFA